MKINKIKEYWFWGLPFLCLLFTTLFSFKPGGETWGYWAFSRILADTGQFIIPDRSPIYTIYLLLFRGFQYPTSIILESITSTSITILAIILFSKRYVGLFSAILISILWIPFLQVSEPPVQQLALACSLFGVILRLEITRPKRSLSYALFFTAYLLRPTYSIMIVAFLLWDIYKYFKTKSKTTNLKNFIPKFYDIPIIVLFVLYLTFLFFQSEHTWNTAWVTTSTWFPNDGKKLSDAGFIQAYNWQFIWKTYGSFNGHDFYHTNQTLFNGKNTMLSAIMSNPLFVFKEIIANTVSLIKQISALMSGFIPKTSIDNLLLFSISLWGLWKASSHYKNSTLNLFIISHILGLAAIVLIMPKPRYLFPTIPLFIISSSWLIYELKRRLSQIQFSMINSKLIQKICILFILITFSPTLPYWKPNIMDTLSKLQKKESLLVKNPKNIHTHVQTIENIFKSCKGILSLEHTFLAGHTSLSIKQLYDVWEIPPFGYYEKNNTIYNGLRPERINCLLISKNLSTGVGAGTNYQLRYENYILPYEKVLLEMGAKKHTIKDFGYAIIIE